MVMSALSSLTPLYIGEAYRGHVIHLRETAPEEQLPTITEALGGIIGQEVSVRYNYDRGTRRLQISEPETADPSLKLDRRQALKDALSPKYIYMGTSSVRCRADLTGEHAATHVKIDISSDEGTVTTVPEVAETAFLGINGVIGGIVVPRTLKNPGHISHGPYNDGYILAALDREAGYPDAELLKRGLGIAEALAEVAGVYLPSFPIPPRIFQDEPLPIIGAYGHSRSTL